MTSRLTVVALITLLAPGSAANQSQDSSRRLFAALAVPSGGTICEIGAGDGAMSIEAARLVGTGGRIYSSELGEARVKTLRDRISAAGLTQVTVITGDPVKTNFPDAGCDAVFMKDVYHHFADPMAMNASITAALKPGGRLGIVDFTPPPGSEASVAADRDNDGMHGITPETLSKELSAAGFAPVSTESSGRWFLTVVMKPKAPDCN
jgi:ubiquinone/menaquinone biosynthesis C-methylase UbiE